MRVDDLFLEGAKVITFPEHSDSRGKFFELYSQGKYNFIKMDEPQDNVSITAKKGTFRGLHWQTKPYQQGKLVSVLQGVVYDLIIDLRTRSSTFGKMIGVILTGNKQLWVPPGFGHGFQTLTDNVLFHYKCTSKYSKEHERSLNILDPIFDNKLPIELEGMSDKDKTAPYWAKVCKEIV